MKYDRIILCLVAVCFFFPVQPALSANTLKIGIVNTQKVLITSAAGKAARAKVSAARRKREDELKKKGKEIEELKSRLQREAMVLSQEVRDTREREIRIKINDLKSFQIKYRQELQRLEKKLLDDLRKKILKQPAIWEKRDGYRMIIDRVGSALIPLNRWISTDR